VRSAAFFLAEQRFFAYGTTTIETRDRASAGSWLSLGLALVMFSFALVAKHYMMG
jgi:hypothetical protein